MSALGEWSDQLASMAIPQAILDAAPESPWGFPTELFISRGRAASERSEPTPTTARALEVLPEGGSVLDVGVGGGATSLPLAGHAGWIVGVDQQEGLLAAFLSAAAEASVSGEAVRGSWPDAAERTPEVDVAVCGHVVYNVGDLGPFASALDDRARLRVVIELTEEHPLAWMSDLWRRFHDLDRPAGPNADTCTAALGELGFAVSRQTRPHDAHGGGFSSAEDAIALVRRRLCLPSDADGDIRAALGDRLVQHDGLWSVGPPERSVITLWWDPAPADG